MANPIAAHPIEMYISTKALHFKVKWASRGTNNKIKAGCTPQNGFAAIFSSIKSSVITHITKLKLSIVNARAVSYDGK